MRDLEIALRQFVRSFRVGSSENRRPVKGDLRHNAMVISGQPTLDRFPVEHITRVIEVEKTPEVRPRSIPPARDLDVAVVGSTGIVVGVAAKVARREERIA